MKIDQYIGKIAFALFIIAATAYRISGSDLAAANIIFWLNEIIRPLVVLFLICFSVPAQIKYLTKKAAIGLVCSLAAAWFFKGYVVSYKPLVWVFFLSATLFYTSFLIFSFFSIGRSFGLIPALRKIAKQGAFALVRHPIYSSYIHLMISFTAVFPNWQNIVLLGFLILGLTLRISAEESILLETNEYQEFKSKQTYSIFSPIVSAPVLFLLFGIGYTKFFTNTDVDQSKNLPLKVIGATSIQSLNPTIYDEWGAVFIGNHIYPRLLPDEDETRAPFFGKITSNECILGTDQNCKKRELRIEIKEMRSCKGYLITAEIIKKEIDTLFKKKPWIISKYSFCQSNTKNEICINLFDVQGDFERRLRSLYQRHGWSVEGSSNNTVFGVEPYCFVDILRDGENIIGGRLKPKDNTRPELLFRVEDGSLSDFDIALYGSENLVTPNKNKILPHTPLAYYLVSNPNFLTKFHWNTNEVVQIITNFMKKNSVIIVGGDEFEGLLPSGNATESKNSLENGAITLLIPDFLPNCVTLMDQLNSYWGSKDFKNVKAKCGDLMKIIAEATIGGNKSWAGFITPIVPSAFFRRAVYDQYFSSNSPDSWLKNSSQPEKYFHRLGLAQSYLVTSKSVCSLKPNPMGISDILISDFIFCK